MSFRDYVILSFRYSLAAKLKCILFNNFYVCGPTSMKRILHLVAEVSKVLSQNSGQGVMSLGTFSKFKMHFA